MVAGAVFEVTLDPVAVVPDFVLSTGGEVTVDVELFMIPPVLCVDGLIGDDVC